MISNIDNRVRLAIFQKKVEIAPDTFEFYFKVEGEFDYLPGQYVWLQFSQLKYEDPQGDRRAMSILNIPNEEKIISFLFRNGQSGFKKQIFELREGEGVNIIGPFGDSFCLPKETGKKLILISGGVGIAPFISLIRYVEKNNIDQKIELISVHDTRRNILYESELIEIKNKNIKTSIIHGDLEQKNLKNTKDNNNLYYISGTQNFVNTVYKILKDFEVDDTQMHFEYFYPRDKASFELEDIFKKQDIEGVNKQSILFTGIQDSSHHLIVTDKNGFIIFANAAAQKITGFTFDEMKGNTPRLWGGLMSKDFYKKVWKSKMDGNIIDEEIINRRKNNEIYYVISHISPIKNKNGEVIGFVATEEDVTPIKKQEENLIQVNKDLEKFALMTADRELKMIELKQEIKKLKEKK